MNCNTRIQATVRRLVRGLLTAVMTQERGAFPRRCPPRKDIESSAFARLDQREAATILAGQNQAAFAALRRRQHRETLRQIRRHGKAETLRYRGMLRP